MPDEVTMKTSAAELLYLAEQQRQARCMMRDDDHGGIRESIVIEAALRKWADSITSALPETKKAL